jgi:pantoate--beta-alanine ligase
MIIAKSIKKVRKEVLKAKKKGKVIGFVPTMGYLHKGHIRLVKEARKKTDYVVVSIFVNPTQFGPKEDYREYPRDLKSDCNFLKKENVDLIFIPDVKDIYPKEFSTKVMIYGSLINTMCGIYRPGHFPGVCTVVTKLFNIVLPDFAFFGKKDYQQFLIIKKIAKDLNFSVKIIAVPTVREKDGLALSSRNTYLSKKEREKALSIYKSLKKGKELLLQGEKNVAKIKEEMKKIMKDNVKIQYLEIKDAETLKNIKTVKGRVVLAVAAFCGKTRLIDNLTLNISGAKNEKDFM